MRTFKTEKCIENDEDYNDYCSCLLDDWLEGIDKDSRYTRPPVPGEDPEEAGFMYTDRGADMVERAISRLYRLGDEYFPDGIIDIKTNGYIEFD